MVKFVTICGGKIKRSQGRFGGDSASRQGERSIRRSRFADMQRDLTAADRRLAAAALEDDATSYFAFDDDTADSDVVSFAGNDSVHPGTALYNHLFDGRAANDSSACARAVSMRNVSRTSILHNDRNTRTYRDGMRIYSARY
jgi:hypothetical protein